jgi:anti-sigma B factor antagonist
VSNFTVVVDECTPPRVRLVGELDLTSRDVCEMALTPLCGVPNRVEVDCSELTFIDSTGLAVLLQMHRAVTDAGGSLELLQPSRMLVKLLEMTGLDALLPVLDD